MRVKLSYSVEADDVFEEAANLINRSGSDMEDALSAFSRVQKELRGELDEEGAMVNPTKALEMIEGFRLALFNIDSRLSEVAHIIQGFEAQKHANFVAAEQETGATVE